MKIFPAAFPITSNRTTPSAVGNSELMQARRTTVQRLSTFACGWPRCYGTTAPFSGSLCALWMCLEPSRGLHISLHATVPYSQRGPQRSTIITTMHRTMHVIRTNGSPEAET